MHNCGTFFSLLPQVVTYCPVMPTSHFFMCLFILFYLCLGAFIDNCLRSGGLLLRDSPVSC